MKSLNCAPAPSFDAGNTTQRLDMDLGRLRVAVEADEKWKCFFVRARALDEVVPVNGRAELKRSG
jgi:hypothetical protein